VAARLERVLSAIEERGGIEAGSDDPAPNPSLRQSLDGLHPADRDRLLLAPDFRRWIARLVAFFDPLAEPGGPVPVQLQAVWNQLAIPWLDSPASASGSLWLLVFGNGRVPFPGTGLSLVQGGEGRRVRMVALGEQLRFEAENGALLAAVGRRELTAAAKSGGPPPPGFIASRRLADTMIEVVASDIEEATVATLDEASRRLATAWPAGHGLVSKLVRRIQLDPNPDLNSKTESELPGLVILGRHRTDWAGVAELLVHEATHLLVYEVARLTPVLPAPREIRSSPFSREGRRPAYMVLHGTASFLAQAIATLRLDPNRERSAAALQGELGRLEAGEGELRHHLDAHAAQPHPLVAALFAELDLLRRALRGEPSR
jgi:HEXXH motif-containing protein